MRQGMGSRARCLGRARACGPSMQKPTDSGPWALIARITRSLPRACGSLCARNSAGSFRRLVLATDRLHDESVADRLGADLDANDLPVDDGADLLDVRAELAGRDPGHLRADAAQ